MSTTASGDEVNRSTATEHTEATRERVARTLHRLWTASGASGRWDDLPWDLRAEYRDDANTILAVVRPTDRYVAALEDIALGRIRHVYNGACPDDLEGWTTRDPDCPACQVLLMRAGSEPQ